MKRFSILLPAVVLLAWSAVAQTGTQAQTQTNAGASSNTSVSADKGGVKAQNDTSATASQNTSADREGKGKTQAGTSGSASSSQSAEASPKDASVAAGTTLNAVLSKSIDSKKAKEGDEVTAKTTAEMKAEGQRTIPKGTKLIGHVTKANARAKGDSESALGIVFDRAEVGKGREIPIHAVIQALAVSRTAATMAMNEESMGAPPERPSASGGSTTGGGLVGGTVAGVGKTVDNTTGAATGVAQGVGAGAVGSASGTINSPTNATATLTSSSQGVVGLAGYTLDAAAANATQGSVITSSGKNVKLESGTQMVLRVVSE